MLYIRHRKYYKLLNCHLLNKRIKLKTKREEMDAKFRFEFEGSYLCEFYVSLEDSKLICMLNRSRLICSIDKVCMVYNTDVPGLIFIIT